MTRLSPHLRLHNDALSRQAKQGVTPVEKPKPRGKRSALKHTTELKHTDSLRRTSGPKRKGFTPASGPQKDKAQEEGCRITGEHGPHVHPAHVIPRGMGGCDHPDCIVPLRADYHRLYDRGKLDVLPHLTLDEQAHAASHVGLQAALKRTTNENYIPEGAVA